MISLRGCLRRLIGGEGHVGPIRECLLKRLDPAEWYLRTDGLADPVSMTATTTIGWVSYSSQPSMIDASSDSRLRGNPLRLERVDALESKFGGLFASKLDELRNQGLVVLPTTNGSLTARLLQSKSGTVLDNQSAAPTGEVVGHAKLRIDAPGSAQTERQILSLLAQKVAQFGPDCRPISPDPPDSPGR